MSDVNSVLRNLQAQYPDDFAVVDGYIKRLEAAVVCLTDDKNAALARAEADGADAVLRIGVALAKALRSQGIDPQENPIDLSALARAAIDAIAQHQEDDHA